MGNEAGPDDLIHAADDNVCGIKRPILSDGSLAGTSDTLTLAWRLGTM